MRPGSKTADTRPAEAKYRQRHPREVENHRDHALCLVHQLLNVGPRRIAAENSDCGNGPLDHVHAHDEHQEKQQRRAAAEEAPEDAACECLAEGVENQRRSHLHCFSPAGTGASTVFMKTSSSVLLVRASDSISHPPLRSRSTARLASSRVA